ncbi:MAG: DUF4097 family beta strand repeat protein [Opitutaceae bacterium]|nr:DUF4097 family beta strand repeat protein [Opitutaceae bacterium]
MTCVPVFRTLVPAAAFAIAAALSATSVSAETVDTIDKSFKVAAGGTLSVDVDAGSIEVNAAPGDTVKVQVVRKFRASSKEKEQELLAKHTVKIEQSGNDVSIYSRGESVTRSFWSWFGGGTGREVRYIVTVPASYNADLKTSGGPIAADGLRGRVEANTSGGPLAFANIAGPISGGTSGGPIALEKCDGDVDLHTSGGPVSAENCSGTFKLSSSGGGIGVEDHRGTLKLHTSGGGIDVDNIDGSVDASTSGGPVAASFRGQPTGDCRLHTSGGGVSLEIPRNARFTLDAHTSGGGVSCDMSGGTNIEKSRGNLRATYNGGGPRIELSSSGGGIDIEATGGVEG